MKLVCLLFLTVTIPVSADQDYISYSPQLQTPSPRPISSENYVYLRPESFTPIPFFSIKNNNKLPFPFLPPNEIKDDNSLPTPVPYYMSSSVVAPIAKNDDEDVEDDSRRSSPMPMFLRNKINPTLKNKINSTYSIPEKHKIEKSDTYKIQKMNTHQPIDRTDMKLLNQITMNNGPTTPYTVTYAPTSRSMIISADTRSDQFKPENYHNYMNVQVPKFYITPTTETAIPILRLSNEMDLDGSFSYEALGADQTHYVQHSRIENFGNDNQEQVVEGSYSYVGDNGQTYTVNYTADSNGFRAYGDHLPVAPPIPEIIQRSIQYNLAKEARMPPGMKSEDKETEPKENEKLHLFTHSTQNLFTGRTPQSFSFGLPGYDMKSNLIPSASTEAPMKTNIEFLQDFMQDKPSATISPQITFLASQGAHVPSFNTAEETIPRHNSMDKPNMLQLINYEAPLKDNDQEGNKGLWRWQYGQNTELNHNPEKNTISRSSATDEDIMINFNDITPNQYQRMITTQLVSDQNISDNNSKNKIYEVKNKNPNIVQNYNFVSISNEKDQKFSTETVITSTQNDNWQEKFDHINHKNNWKFNHFSEVDPFDPEVSTTAFQSKINSQHVYVPPTERVKQSNDYEKSFYEPKRISSLKTNATSISEINQLIADSDYNDNYDLWIRPMNAENNTISTHQKSYFSTSESTPFRSKNTETPQNKNGFTPIFNAQTDYSPDKVISQISTETVADILKENVFLKNVFSEPRNGFTNNIPLKNVNKIEYRRKSDINTNDDNAPNFKPLPSPSYYHEVKSVIRKPIDIADVLNYISSKNQFESSKIKPKFKESFQNFNEELHITPQKYRYEGSENISDHSVINNRNNERQEGLRGIIKNYKILQRNNGDLNKDKDTDKVKRVLTVSQEHNLPPPGRAGPSMKSYLPPTYY